MRILVINNYSMQLLMKNQRIPRHHVWGIDVLTQSNEIFYLHYHCPCFLGKFHLSRIYYYWFQFMSLLMSIRCECVYAAASPLIELLAYLKYKGWVRKKLFMVVHHPRNFSLHKRSYTRLIFISRIAYNQACYDYSQNQFMFVYNEWGPDITFYDNIIKDRRATKPKSSEMSFVSNGKANRDHDILVAASRGLDARVSIICTRKSAPSNYEFERDKNISVLIQDAETIMSNRIMSYPDMVNVLQTFDVVVIPISANYKALCGLTTFNDAIALGKPVIVSDTANLGINIEKEGFGFFYKGGDVESLKEKMLWFVEHPKMVEVMGRKARWYAEKHDNKMFSKRILELIENENSSIDISSE